jgi:hypothetical protein
MLTSPVASEASNIQRKPWDSFSDTLSGPDSYISPYLGPADSSRISPIRRLVSKLPTRPQFEELVSAYFAERNWQFGIPERWFQSACQKMWDHLGMPCLPGCRRQGECPACKEDINPHWLSLCFAVLALGSSCLDTPKDGGKYLMHAVTAIRSYGDILLVTPVYSTSEGAVHGGVLSCYAVVLLAMYLIDHGRVSEAWKLIGTYVLLLNFELSYQLNAV